jgi:hypothetical protein
MGRVIAADTGRPLRLARVSLTGGDLAGGRLVLTDDTGGFALDNIPAGRYTLTASKSGFLTLSYGQRRPFQSGSVLSVADGAEIKGVDFSLPRGSVIAGFVGSSDGDWLSGVTVRILREARSAGTPLLIPTGITQTDDRGAYRIWGLMPGEYYVTASLSPELATDPTINAQIVSVYVAASNDNQEHRYAPTFYPGTVSLNTAIPITVGLGQEVLDVSFSLQLLRMARINGHVLLADGNLARNGSVVLLGHGASAGHVIREMLGSGIRSDGTFSIQDVPAGDYLVCARSDISGKAEFGSEVISVGDGDVATISLTLAEGATVGGRLVWSGTQSGPRIDPTRLQITAPMAETGVFAGPQRGVAVTPDGGFNLKNIPPGRHYFRADNISRGWALQSVLVDGNDIIDSPIEIRPGQILNDVTLVFTDRMPNISGAVLDQRGQPCTDCTVLAFPVNSQLWRSGARQIVTGRPDQYGHYQLQSLPPGDYYLAAVDLADGDAWFDPAFLERHRASAIRLSLAYGNSQVQNLTIRQ